MSDTGEATQKGAPRGSGYQRNEADWYVEPRSAVHALLDAERFWGVVYDPACGGGTIPSVCREHGLSAVAADIVDRGFEGALLGDFLIEPDWISADHIITNPPYQHALEFALKAIGLARHKVAILVRLAYLEGDARYQRLFEKHPPARVLVFRNRISCPPGGVDLPAKGGAVAYCWIVWSKDHRGPTELAWIKADRRLDAAALGAPL